MSITYARLLRPRVSRPPPRNEQYETDRYWIDLRQWLHSLERTGAPASSAAPTTAPVAPAAVAGPSAAPVTAAPSAAPTAAAAPVTAAPPVAVPEARVVGTSQTSIRAFFQRQ